MKAVSCHFKALDDNHSHCVVKLFHSLNDCCRKAFKMELRILAFSFI
ncbi:MAG: hypothetical protein NT165_01775 [Candidatus Falkowbacteria bacterium]|nr:hypothetical protein [Candidatus Falkowbacteria bacterium]